MYPPKCSIIDLTTTTFGNVVPVIGGIAIVLWLR